MIVNNALTNPVNLKQVKAQGLISELNLILKDDLWKKETLLLRSGKYLTEKIVDKLINMGIFEVNILLNDDIYKEESRAVEELKHNFVKNQTVFILTKEFRSVIMLVRSLLKQGFKEKNMFVINEYKNLKKYFKIKKPFYIFIDDNFCMETYKFIKTFLPIFGDAHIFVLKKNERNNDNREFESRIAELNAKVLIKPVNYFHLKHLINGCIDRDFCTLLKNERIENNNLIESA